MNEPIDSLARLLVDVIVPNLKAVQASQAEQITANNRLEQTLDELRLHLDSQFAHLAAQLTACRVELAATQAVLKAADMQSGVRRPGHNTLVH